MEQEMENEIMNNIKEMADQLMERFNHVPYIAMDYKTYCNLVRAFTSDIIRNNENRPYDTIAGYDIVIDDNMIDVQVDARIAYHIQGMGN